MKNNLDASWTLFSLSRIDINRKHTHMESIAATPETIHLVCSVLFI